jgi:hypothetical protein
MAKVPERRERRAYISSTYEDQRAERAAVIDGLSRLSRIKTIAMEHYTAAPSTPLEHCRKDVRESDIYIGIFAWRYGFLPEGETKSITHLEYEAAREAGIPCFVFLRDGEPPAANPRPADRARALEFRDELRRGPMCGSFTTPDQLSLLVMAALYNHVLDSDIVAEPDGEPRDVPPLLPYKVDRSSQSIPLLDALARHRSDAPSAPFIWAVHGSEHECHEKFVLRLAEDWLPDLLGEEAPVRTIRVACPGGERDAKDAWRELESEVADRLTGSRLTDRSRLREAIRAAEATILVHLEAIAHEWRSCSADVVARFLDLVADWNVAEEERPIIVGLSFAEPAGERRGLWPWSGRTRRARACRESIVRLAEQRGFALLPDLEPIGQSEVLQWLVDPDVQSRIDEDAVRVDVEKIFSSTDRISMRPLGKRLKSFLAKRSTTRAAS